MILTPSSRDSSFGRPNIERTQSSYLKPKPKCSPALKGAQDGCCYVTEVLRQRGTRDVIKSPKSCSLNADQLIPSKPSNLAISLRFRPQNRLFNQPSLSRADSPSHVTAIPLAIGTAPESTLAITSKPPNSLRHLKQKYPLLSENSSRISDIISHNEKRNGLSQRQSPAASDSLANHRLTSSYTLESKTQLDFRQSNLVEQEQLPIVPHNRRIHLETSNRSTAHSATAFNLSKLPILSYQAIATSLTSLHQSEAIRYDDTLSGSSNRETISSNSSYSLASLNLASHQATIIKRANLPAIRIKEPPTLAVNYNKSAVSCQDSTQVPGRLVRQGVLFARRQHQLGAFGASSRLPSAILSQASVKCHHISSTVDRKAIKPSSLRCGSATQRRPAVVVNSLESAARLRSKSSSTPIATDQARRRPTTHLSTSRQPELSLKPTRKLVSQATKQQQVNVTCCSKSSSSSKSSLFSSTSSLSHAQVKRPKQSSPSYSDECDGPARELRSCVPKSILSSQGKKLIQSTSCSVKQVKTRARRYPQSARNSTPTAVLSTVSQDLAGQAKTVDVGTARVASVYSFKKRAGINKTVANIQEIFDPDSIDPRNIEQSIITTQKLLFPIDDELSYQGIICSKNFSNNSGNERSEPVGILSSYSEKQKTTPSPSSSCTSSLLDSSQNFGEQSEFPSSLSSLESSPTNIDNEETSTSSENMISDQTHTAINHSNDDSCNIDHQLPYTTDGTESIIRVSSISGCSNVIVDDINDNNIIKKDKNSDIKSMETINNNDIENIDRLVNSDREKQLLIGSTVFPTDDFTIPCSNLTAIKMPNKPLGTNQAINIHEQQNDPSMTRPLELSGYNPPGIKNLDIPIRIEMVSDIYDVEARPFARGKFAQVKRCVNRDTKQCFAAKCIKKRRRQSDVRSEILLEIEALKLSYLTDYIIKIFEVFETQSDIILVLEMASGGELQRVVDDGEIIEESSVKQIIRQILEGLTCLHDHDIAHLDIKPQNILLTKPYPNCDVKLCDFGMSRKITKDCETREICGTPDYVAPEILRYDPISLTTDMWSLGILTYVLLTGYSPFAGDTKQQTFCNITQAPLDFPSDIFDKISNEAIDFMTKIIVRDPNHRLTSRQAKDHPWLLS